MKEQYREAHTNFRVTGIQFGVFSCQEMRQIAHINVLTNNLYEPNTRKPAEYGVLDLRLGTSVNDKNCQTCGKGLSECSGHFGYIDLQMPCFHIGFFKCIINILQCICKTCANVLLPYEVKIRELIKINRGNLTYLEKKSLRKRIIKLCKKRNKCPNCGDYNGIVKKCGLLKILHMKHQHGKKILNERVVEFINSFESVLCTNKDLGVLINKAQEVLNPIRVLELFKKIPVADIAILLMDADFGKPEDLILKRILVPPTCIRPSVVSEIKAGTTEDDITMRLLDIIQQNNNLVQMAQNSGWMPRFMEVWDFLQLQVGLLYNSEISGIPKFSQESKKPLMGIVQRLKGKQGRFRGNLSGKRVDFSARTVISPDPHLKIDQVGVPLHMAKILTYPERVNAINLECMQQLVLNGCEVFPGAKGIIKGDSKAKFNLQYGNRTRMARELKVGDIVERNLRDGDVVLFNRQPSLHRLSIQAFYVKISPYRTLRFNECCCNPFNADFDGDEMNIHVPQTEEAKAEAVILMGSKSNIISPRNGEPLIAAIQDFITGAFLLTQKDNFFDRMTAARLAMSLNCDVTLPPPSIIKPVELWTGKQILGLVMKPCKTHPVLVNLRTKCSGKVIVDKSKMEYSCRDCNSQLMRKKIERFVSSPPDCISCPDALATIQTSVEMIDPFEVLCENCCQSFRKVTDAMKIDPCPGCVEYNRSGKKEEMDSSDNFIVVYNSQLLAGCVDKGTLGSGSKSSIFYLILRDFGEQHAADAMHRLGKLTSAYLMERGFSIGIGDVTPGPGLLKTKRHLLQEGYKKCDEYIKQMKDGILQVSPGCTPEETLENTLLKELSNIREQTADACLRELPKMNSPLVMVVSGSKGSNINISQMIACVGQQAVSGKRVPNGFEDRTLPYFEKNSIQPAARGFVENSFYSGLDPTEMFFHTIAGREGLVDTAVKTAETGYMQRRLVKAMEDLHCAYDGTVRNSVGEVVQFVFGSDGLDPMAMEAKYVKSKNSTPTGKEGTRPMDFGRILDQICRECPCKDEGSLTGDQVMRIYTKLLDLDEYKFMRSHKLEEKQVASSKPERARNFGRHMRKFIHSLNANLEKGQVVPDSTCKHSRITRTQLQKFLTTSYSKFMSSQVEPGTAVGALAAQSIGEPGTQMTLKTFHFAGVASMNITQGVPRILEIINASKKISTPVAVCPLEKSFDKEFARRVKGRLERTYLEQVALDIRVALTPDDLFVQVRLDLNRIKLLNLEINAWTIKKSIAESKYKIKSPDIEVISESIIVVRPPKTETKNLLWVLHRLRAELPKIIVAGIPTVKRAVLQIKDKKGANNEEEYELIVEGTNLQAIMTTPGVIGSKVISNNIMEIKHALGIEAARTAIINEMNTTMASHGISVDKRHIMLLADLMSGRGDVMGINRGGMARMRESALMLASFEKTADHLFEAAYHGQKDAIRGVSERIILGIPMEIGTGMFDIIMKPNEDSDQLVHREALFDRDEFHLPPALIRAAQATKYNKDQAND